MKIKQISLFIVIFSAIIISIVFMPSTVFATDISDGMIDMGQIGTENPMSETFKQILNEEGKFVVTDTSHKAETDMQDFLIDYLQKYFAEDGSYTFYAQNYNDNNNGKKTVEIGLWINGQEERHEVEVVFDEQMSENFKKYLKNGSLAIPTSIQEGKADIVMNYAYTLDSGDIMVQAMYINEDCTSCTLQVRERGKIKETHIVPITFVTEKSEEFKKKLNLNKDEKLVVNSKEFTTLEEIGTYIDIVFEGNVMLYDFAEDASWCTVTYMPTGETHKLDIIYNYNKENAEKMKEFVKKFPADRDYFKVQDLELVNYWVNNSDKEDTDTFTNYSGELKGYLNYNNIKLDVIIGAGGDMPYVTERIGRAMFKVDGIAYYMHEFLGTKGEHILYVPDNTGDSKEELIKAAQKRVDEYLGKTGIAEISYAGTAKECAYRYAYEFECKYFYAPEEERPTYEEWLANQMPYEDFGTEVAGIDGVKANDPAFKLKVKYGENKNREYCILIQKDSSKMINPEYKTVDIYTDIEISSASSEIPLDTSITAKKLTSGTEYDNIIKILDVENSVTYDLTLYSASTGGITKLEKEDGTFEVRIPITEELEGKTLIAYYVDENGTVKDYTVTPEDGYAVFTTDHFSIYTLAEKKEEVKDESNNNNDNNLGNNEENNNNVGDNQEDNNNDNTPGDKEEDKNNNDSENKEEDKNNNATGNTITNNVGNTVNNTITNNTTNSTNNSNNPQTGDAIWIFATILLVSVIGVVITTLYKKESK